MTTAMQTLHWVNPKSGQKLKVGYYPKAQDPQRGMDVDKVQSAIQLAAGSYKDAKFPADTVTLAVFRCPENKGKIEGLLGGPGYNPTLRFDSNTKDEGKGAVRIMTNVGRFLSGQALMPYFAGKKASKPAASQPAAKSFSFTA